MGRLPSRARHPGPWHLATQRLSLGERGLGDQRPGGRARLGVVEQAPPERRQRPGEGQVRRVRPAQLDGALEADLRKHAWTGAGPSPPWWPARPAHPSFEEAAEGDALAAVRSGRPGPGRTSARRGPTRRRSGSRSPRLEHERQQTAAVLVHVQPDRGPVALVSVGPSFADGRGGVERGHDRAEARGRPDLVGSVLLAGKIEVHLHRGGAFHHLVAEPAMAGQVLAHDVVAPLGQPGHVVQAAERPKATRDEVDPQRSGHRADLADVAAHEGAGGPSAQQRRAGKLDLHAGLEGDLLPVPAGPDDVFTLVNSGVTVVRDQASEQLGHAPGARVGDRRAVEPHPQLLVLQPHQPLRPGFGCRGEKGHQLVDVRQRLRQSGSLIHAATGSRYHGPAKRFRILGGVSSARHGGHPGTQTFTKSRPGRSEAARQPSASPPGQAVTSPPGQAVEKTAWCAALAPEVATLYYLARSLILRPPRPPLGPPCPVSPTF